MYQPAAPAHQPTWPQRPRPSRYAHTNLGIYLSSDMVESGEQCGHSSGRTHISNEDRHPYVTCGISSGKFGSERYLFRKVH